MDLDALGVHRTAPWGALLTLGALLPLMFANRARHRGARLVFKPLASTGFLWFAWACGALQTAPGVALFVGLALSWVGDVALIFPGRPAFLLGLGAFLLGHVGYAAACLLHGVDPMWALGAAALLLPFSALVYVDLRPRVPAQLMGPVVAYMVVISAMMVLAVGAAGRDARLLLLALGAFLFYLSDISVALDRFLDAGFGNRAIGLPLYYVAQLVIGASAALFLG